MIWESLLSLKRFGDTNKRLRIEQDNLRLGFEVDYDRIVFSNAFRSLQDKTQVIPFSKTDFVHTRLTHSLEVSVVGRSLGRMAGHAILQKHPHLKQSLGYQSNDFGAITAAASLATLSDPLPATKTCTSESILDAAVIAFKVNGLRFLLLCSAINSTDIKLP